MQSYAEALNAPTRLPRLVYVGDVPVEQAMSGSVALWRLLEDYPPEALLIIESRASCPARRLPRVRYASLSPFLWRLARTRYSRAVMPVLLLTARFRARSVAATLEQFGPEAVLTVTHGVSWITAGEIAARRGLPLYLVNHDCWFETVAAPAFAKRWMHRQFSTVYGQAARRFCVSQTMVEYYRNRYGGRGEVLYPGRARDCPDFATAPAQRSGRPFTLAYAGGIFNDCAVVLATVADLMAQINATLVVFSALPPDSPLRSEMAGRGIDWRAFVPADEFVRTLRLEADALLVIRERGMGANAVMSFPSKIVDYTATGLPILLYAPADSAAASWVQAKPEVGLFVAEGDTTGLLQGIRRLATDAGLRKALGQAGLARGRTSFSHERVSQQFLAALRCGALP